MSVVAERPVDEQAERESVAIGAEWHGRRGVTGDVPQHEVADPFERVGGEAFGDRAGPGSVGRADHDVEWCERVAHLPGQGCLALGGGGVGVSVDACIPLVPGPQLGTERIVSGPADLLAVFVEEIGAEWGGDLL